MLNKSTGNPGLSPQGSGGPINSPADNQLEGNLFELTPTQSFIANHEIFSPEPGVINFNLRDLTPIQFVEKVERLLDRQLLRGDLRAAVRSGADMSVATKAEGVAESQPSPSFAQKALRSITGLFSGVFNRNSDADGVLRLPSDGASRPLTEPKPTPPPPPAPRPESNRLFSIDGNVSESQFKTPMGRQSERLTEVPTGIGVAAWCAYTLLSEETKKSAVDLFRGCGVQTPNFKVIAYFPALKMLDYVDLGKKGIEKSLYQQKNRIAGMRDLLAAADNASS